MKNLSDFKKNCDKYVFTMVDYECRNNNGSVVDKTNKLLGIPRKIEKKQSNSIMFVGGSWLQFPKASELSFENDTMIVNEKYFKMTYKFELI